MTGITKVNYQEQIYNNKSVRAAILTSTDDDPNKSPTKDGVGECFNGNIVCRLILLGVAKMAKVPF